MPGGCISVLCIDTDRRPDDDFHAFPPLPRVVMEPSTAQTTTSHGVTGVTGHGAAATSTTTGAAVSAVGDLGGVDGPRDARAERIHGLLGNIGKQEAPTSEPTPAVPRDLHGLLPDSPTAEEAGHTATSPTSAPGIPPPPAVPPAPAVSPWPPAAAASTPPVDPARPIYVSQKWEELNRLGQGSYGTVFKARCLETDTLFAVKKVPFSKEEQLTGKVNACVRALEREISVLQQLRHPNVVQYIRTQRTQDALNILLEYMPGGSIASNLARDGAMEEAKVKVYIKQMLKGLHYLHENKIMHRDIKGANVLVSDGGICKLADFGASKMVEELASVGGNTVAGTPYWMAPEIIKQLGHGRPADIWSLGCCVIEMATGKAPCCDRFTNAMSFLMWISQGGVPELPPNDQLRGPWSQDARSFLTRCFNHTPNRRANARELMMHPWLVGVVTPTPQPPPAPAPVPAPLQAPMPAAASSTGAMPASAAAVATAAATGPSWGREVAAARQQPAAAALRASVRASVNSRPAAAVAAGLAATSGAQARQAQSTPLQPLHQQEARQGSIDVAPASPDQAGLQAAGGVGGFAGAGQGHESSSQGQADSGQMLAGEGDDLVNYGTIMQGGGTDTMVNYGSVMMGPAGMGGVDGMNIGSVMPGAAGVDGMAVGLDMPTWASSAGMGSMFNTMFNPMQEPTLMADGEKAQPFVEMLRRALPTLPEQLPRPAPTDPSSALPVVQPNSPPHQLQLPPRPAARSLLTAGTGVEEKMAAAAAQGGPGDSVVVVHATRPGALQAASKVLDGSAATVSTPEKHRQWEEQLQREIDSARQGQRASVVLAASRQIL